MPKLSRSKSGIKKLNEAEYSVAFPTTTRKYTEAHKPNRFWLTINDLAYPAQICSTCVIF